MPQKIKPTEAELEILQVLWTYGPSNVRFVNDKLKSAREDAESQQQERAKLKARLIEMEMEIQQLIEQNRKKDMEIQSLDQQIKQ